MMFNISSLPAKSPLPRRRRDGSRGRRFTDCARPLNAIPPPQAGFNCNAVNFGGVAGQGFSMGKHDVAETLWVST